MMGPSLEISEGRPYPIVDRRARMADETGKAAESVRLQFHYIKGPSYHEAACHGAIGGPTPQNKI
jgi:hypothetical protein